MLHKYSRECYYCLNWTMNAKSFLKIKLMITEIIIFLDANVFMLSRQVQTFWNRDEEKEVENENFWPVGSTAVK